MTIPSAPPASSNELAARASLAGTLTELGHSCRGGCAPAVDQLNARVFFILRRESARRRQRPALVVIETSFHDGSLIDGLQLLRQINDCAATDGIRVCRSRSVEARYAIAASPPQIELTSATGQIAPSTMPKAVGQHTLDRTLSETGTHARKRRWWERRNTDLVRREVAVEHRERALASHLKLAQDLLTAARERDAAADALDTAADQRERELDLANLLSTANDQGYGSDWPARRHAALDRAHARADRVSAREDLTALAADYREDNSRKSPGVALAGRPDSGV